MRHIPIGFLNFRKEENNDTIFNHSLTPKEAYSNVFYNTEDFFDSTIYELGTDFTVNQPCEIIGLAAFTNLASSTITGRLWNDSGDLLRSATFNITSSGWQLVILETPLSVNTGEEYTVTCNTASDFWYAASVGFFNSPVVSQNGLLTATLGTYNTNPGNYPIESFNNSCYFIDVLVKY